MAFSASDLATLEAAIAAGTLRVKFADGREVTYQDADQMLRVRAAMQSDIAAAAATPPQRMVRVVHVRA